MWLIDNSTVLKLSAQCRVIEYNIKYMIVLWYASTRLKLYIDACYLVAEKMFTVHQSMILGRFGGWD